MKCEVNKISEVQIFPCAHLFIPSLSLSLNCNAMPLICSTDSEDNSPETSPQRKSLASVFVLTVSVCVSYVCLFLCV